MDDKNKRKGILKRVLGVANKAASGVTNAVGGAMALPWTIPAKMKQMQSTSETKLLKQARKYDGAPTMSDNGITDAGKIRLMADGVRAKYGAKKPLKDVAKSAVKRAKGAI